MNAFVALMLLAPSWNLSVETDPAFWVGTASHGAAVAHSSGSAGYRHQHQLQFGRVDQCHSLCAKRRHPSQRQRGEWFRLHW